MPFEKAIPGVRRPPDDWGRPGDYIETHANEEGPGTEVVFWTKEERDHYVSNEDPPEPSALNRNHDPSDYWDLDMYETFRGQVFDTPKHELE